MKAFAPAEVRLLSCAMDDLGFAALPNIPDERLRHQVLEYRFNRFTNRTTSTKPVTAKPAVTSNDDREQMLRRLALATTL
jgi:hypothetical protein